MSPIFGNDTISHINVNHHIQKEAQCSGRLRYLEKIQNFKIEQSFLLIIFYELIIIMNTYCKNINHTMQKSGSGENSKCQFCCC